MNFDRRISALETEANAGGVAVICLYDGETNEEAAAAHIAAGGADPFGAEIRVFIHKFCPRPPTVTVNKPAPA